MPLWSAKEEESQIILEAAGDLGSKIILDSTDGTSDAGFYILQKSKMKLNRNFLIEQIRWENWIIVLPIITVGG